MWILNGLWGWILPQMAIINLVTLQLLCINYFIWGLGISWYEPLLLPMKIVSLYLGLENSPFGTNMGTYDAQEPLLEGKAQYSWPPSTSLDLVIFIFKFVLPFVAKQAT